MDNHSKADRNPLLDFFAVPFRARTYGSVLYIWLGFPLGLAYFVGLIVGFSAGIPLTLIWVGLVVLFMTLGAAWLAEGFERQMAIRLLGAAVPTRLPAASMVPGRRLDHLRAVGGSAALWKGLLFLGLKFPLGLACWVVSLVALIVPIAFIASPFALLFNGGAVDLGFWHPTSFVSALPLALAGALALLISLHLHNALGWIWARLAEWLLGAELPGSRAAVDAPALAA